MAKGLKLQVLGGVVRGGRKWYAAYSGSLLVEFTLNPATSAEVIREVERAYPTDGEEVRVDVTNIDQYHSIRGVGDNGPQS